MLSKILIVLIIVLGQSLPVLAHGGEDHSEEKQSPVASIGEMNAKLARTDDYEVLVKYPNPKFGEETLLRLFVTELITNKPVSGMKIAMAFNHEDKPNMAAIETVAAPTATMGIYEAHTILPDSGRYNILLRLSGENINEQMTISGIVVPPTSAAESATQNSSLIRFTVALSIFLIFLIAAGYIFWLRPRRFQQSDSEARRQIA
jgi:hypothetical protein